MMPVGRAAVTGNDKAARLASVDAFRGATVAAMILVNAQYSHEESYRQLAHAEWHGWTFADTIFPTFLFIVGLSLTLSTAARAARGNTSTQLLVHALERALIIIACGIAIDNIRFPVREFPFIALQDHLQITGVLQKIAICYFIAFAIHLWTGLRGAVLAICGFNILYLGLLYYYPIPGCPPGSLTESCNFPGYVDQIVLDGHRWQGDAFDPDGVGALLPATTSVLFGVAVGEFLRSVPARQRRSLLLSAVGVALLLLGGLSALWVPVNKHLWTPSFAILMAGLSTTGVTLFVLLVDGCKWRAWCAPLEILGKHALEAYLLSRLIANVPRIRVGGHSLYTDILERMAQPQIASLLFATVVLALVFLPIWLLERQQWRLRL